MKPLLTFILGLVVAGIVFCAICYSYPQIIVKHVITTEMVYIAQEIKDCKAWGGDYDVGKSVPEGDYPLFLYGHYIYKPYKDIGDGWAESCTKSNTTSDSFY